MANPKKLQHLLYPDFHFEISRGAVPKYSAVHKFGRNPALTTSYTPIAQGGIYRTPQVSGATTLRVKAGNTNDTAAGIGARSILLQGLDETGAEVTEVIPTAGLAAGASSTTTFLRLYRAYVYESGAYASATTGSHVASIVIENTAGTEDWAVIENTTFARSQTEICCYTVPLGYTAYIEAIWTSVEASKAVDLIMFQRQNILETAPPYTAMRIVAEFHGTEGNAEIVYQSPLGPFPELTDLGLMGQLTAGGSGNPDVEGDLEIILVQNQQGV